MIAIIIYSIIFLVLLVTLILMILRNRRGRKQNNSISKPNATVLELLPFAFYDTLHDCYVYKDKKTCMDILQIKSKDLMNASSDSIEYDLLRFTKLYRVYPGDMKIIVTNYPTTTDEQQQYLRYKKANTKNAIFREWLDKKEEELQWLESHRTSREYFFMFWGKDSEELLKRRELIMETLGTTNDGLIIPLSEDKKMNILFKLNNKNMTIVGKEK